MAAELRYMKNIRQVLMKKRQQHIMEINKQSPYKEINIMDKNFRESNVAERVEAATNQKFKSKNLLKRRL